MITLKVPIIANCSKCNHEGKIFKAREGTWFHEGILDCVQCGQTTLFPISSSSIDKGEEINRRRKY